ncbi:MAG TPA: ATP-binding protein [Ktedonobacterales bacterium]|nr:ATP-binding protein [Ktedonobacterales bacterium]
MASVTAPTVVAGRGRSPRGFFGILGHSYGYRNLLYLLLAPPITYLYVVLFLVILGLGNGGFTAFAPILILALAWPATVVERGLARALLDVEFTPMARSLPPGSSAWDHLKAHLLNPVTWKSLVYLVTRVFFGVFAFFLNFVLLAIAFAALLAPPVYLALLTVDWHAVGIFLWWRWWPLSDIGRLSDAIARYIAPNVSFSPQGMGISLLLVPVGVVLCAVALHIFHGVGMAWGWYARNMLGVNPKDIELAEARAATAAARQRADAAEKDRRQLVLDASHELRTPVATIRAHIDALLLLEGDQLSERVRAYLATTQHEIERLSLLVDDLLMLARSDSDGLELTITPVAVGAVVEEVFQALEPLAAHERQVTLVRHVAADLPDALADRARLAQVILNLARNAITYTPAGGIVALDVTPGAEPGTLAITVTDTGIGIAEDDLPHIFERFYRSDASRARHSGGFGLGLSITRDLVRAMGGGVTAERVAEGGSRFIVTLPLAHH